MSEMHDYETALAAAGTPLLKSLAAFEAVQRRLHPPQIGSLKEALEPHRSALADGLAVLDAATPPEPLADFHDRLLPAGGKVAEALEMFLADVPADQAIMQVLGSMRRYTDALEMLYGLHRFPPIGRFFVESPLRDKLDALDPDPPDGVTVGLHNTGGDDPHERGGFCLYVPETYDGTRELPLVVALHGGSGNGRGFLWTWLREARGRGFILLSPTSRGPTWSLAGPDIDAEALLSMVAFVRERWRIDSRSMLLTGLSDGATYSLMFGLGERSPFTALAPLSGVVHPANQALGNMQRARGRRIYLVHGALDWMFPVETARWGAEELEKAGADIVYREIDDLSHTYAREENARILEWLDPALALP